MKFSIGDKILVKRTGEEGHVVAFINDEMVEVEIKRATFPMYIEDLDHPYLKWFTEKKKGKPGSAPEQLPVERIKDRPKRLAQGIYLSFIPVFKPDMMEDIVDHVKVHLLNELPTDIFFKYDCSLPGQKLFNLEGKLHAFGNLYLHNVAYEDMGAQPRFNWEIEDAAKEKQPLNGTIRIKPPKLFEHINHLLQNNEPSFSYKLLDDLVEGRKTTAPIAAEGLATPKHKEKKTRLTLQDLPRYELDLHIEKLVNNIQGLSNADMLQIQLNELHHALDLARRHRQERMVIIHGLGKGVLRDEVHKILKATPEVLRFTDGWQGQYGFGATEVLFKY